MRNSCLLFIGLLFGITLSAQVGINTTTPDASASLDIESTNSGILIPRMTEAQKNAITTPATGLLIYQTNGTDPGFYFYNGTAWDYLTANGAKDINDLNDGITDGTGSSTFLGLNAGASDDGTTNWNTAVGRDAMTANTSGSFNTAFGAQSLEMNTTGHYNTAMGEAALRRNTTGNSNVSVGYSALNDNTTGTSNVAVGYRSLDANTTGDYNIALGGFSLFDNTTSTHNVAIGYQSLYNTDGGNYNIGLGSFSLYRNTTGAYNMAIGANSLYNNTTGSDNLAMGYLSLFVNTDGTNNIAIGRESLRSNSSGDHNLAIGYQALYNNTTSSENIAIGDYALYQNQTGQRNTSIGFESLNANTASGNTAVGHQSLLLNTTGFNNTAVGGGALDTNTTGRNNTAVGGNSLSSATIANGNSMFGSSAGSSMTTGEENTALGYSALWRATTGDFNVAVGAESLNQITTGYQNTAVGYEAGGNVNSFSRNNVFIGYQAGRGSTNRTLIGSIMIGVQAGASETNNNRLYIENSASSNPLIYGEFDNDILRTNGEFQIGNPASTGYRFPTTDGASGEVLTTDGAGTVSWASASSSPSIARATMSGTQTISGVGNHLIAFDVETFDLQGDYDHTTYRYTVPATGIYRVNGNLIATTSAFLQFAVFINGTEYLSHLGGVSPRNIDTLLQLTTNDIIEFYVVSTSTGSTSIGGSSGRSFIEIQQID